MCDTCGCTPCNCGREIENGVCAGCSKPASECTCEEICPTCGNPIDDCTCSS